MKLHTLIPICFFLLFISCKKETELTAVAHENLRIDSINAQRELINDSIRQENAKNRFAKLSNSPLLSFSSDDAKFEGPISLESLGRDRYKVSGTIAKGGSKLEIHGELKRVSKIYLNFEGTIDQQINNRDYKRQKKMTFAKEGNVFRLQDKVGGQGFVEYIDIHLQN